LDSALTLQSCQVPHEPSSFSLAMRSSHDSTTTFS
jgi:hypothetical protein